MNNIVLRVTFLFASIVLLISCNSKSATKSDNLDQMPDSIYTIKYAKGFEVKIYSDYKDVIVRNPWDTTQILQRYLLVDKQKSIPANLPKGTIIRTPLSKVIAYSTIHSSTLEELNDLQSITGVCDPKYIDISYIQEGIAKGTIKDLGQASNPIIETIIDLDPEAIWATPLKGENYGKVQNIGIPIIETPDYVEPTPLGRAEWIRFYSLFYNQEQLGDSLFNKTVQNYNVIKDIVKDVKDKPTVFLDLMYRSIWYIQGGESFISKMLADAGATYMWAGDGDLYTKQLSFEQVLDKASTSKFWLIKQFYPNDTLTYTKLKAEYKPYSYFEAFKAHNIYWCNTAENTYYEDLPIHPDYILKDFAFVFHPELFPGYKPRYYRPLSVKD